MLSKKWFYNVEKTPLHLLANITIVWDVGGVLAYYQKHYACET